MKEEQIRECANCGAKVPSYMGRCPDCGLLLPRSKVTSDTVAARPQSTTPSANKKVPVLRHPFVTFWLWLLIVVDSLVCLFVLAMVLFATSSLTPQEIAFFSIYVVLLIEAVFGFVLLLKRRRLGFYIVLSAVILGWATCAIMLNKPAWDVSIIVLYGVLQIKRKGIRYWDTLK